MSSPNRLLSNLPVTKISKLKSRDPIEIAQDAPMTLTGDAAGDLKLEIFKTRVGDNPIEEVGILKEKLAMVENRYKNLFYENEKTNIDLVHERHRVGQLERKLKFVKDNRSIFEKLKEAYVSMKYNQSAGRKLVEIRDKSVQTWEGILCKACLETENLRAELESATTAYRNCVVISKEEMETINSTFRKLKDFALNGSNDNNELKGIEVIETNQENRVDHKR